MSNTYYGDYLKLGQLLDCQSPRSEELKRPAHEEMLFIITHQTYELWFKQILHELQSVLQILEQKYVEDQALNLVVTRLERIIEIEQLLIQQIQVMETMQPLDFLDFRDLLVPASGFQSFQFRLIENHLGLQSERRLKYHQSKYHESLSPEHQLLMRSSERETSLYAAVEAWLERTPFLQFGDYDFWLSYRQAVADRFSQDREIIKKQPVLSPEDIEKRLNQVAKSESDFELLFNPQSYEENRQAGHLRLSYRAAQAALLIILYRERPILQMPYRLLTALSTIDEQLTTWRYRHAQMIQRMIGSKPGTGGSMGYAYLIQTLESHRIFGDFNQLTTYLIPRSSLPDLPEAVSESLGFAYHQEQT